MPTVEDAEAATRLTAAKAAGMRAAIAWNNAYPIGTRVRYWPGTRDEPARTGLTRSQAWVLGHGAPVVKVQGHAGGIALMHVEPEAEVMS